MPHEWNKPKIPKNKKQSNILPIPTYNSEENK